MVRNRGITLITLIVTIIVLLILAGITIGFAISNNGIIGRSNEAKFKQEMVELKRVVNEKVISGETIELRISWKAEDN